MSRLRLPSLRSTLVVVMVVILVSTSAALVYIGREERKAALTNAGEQALRMARLAAERQQRLVESTQQLLFVLVRLPAVRAGEPQECRTLFETLLRQYPRFANLGLANLQGTVIASGAPLRGRVNVADSGWFQRLISKRDLAPGDYRVDRITGKPVVVVDHPVLDEEGRLKFITFAALDLHWVNQLVKPAKLPADSVLTIADGRGRVLARTLDPEKWVASAEPESAIIKDVPLTMDAWREAPGVDGVTRVYAFTHLYSKADEASAYVSVGIPVGAVQAKADLVYLLAAGLAMLPLLALAVIRGVRKDIAGMRSREAAMKRLSAGDLSARASLKHENRDIRQPSGSFNVLAQNQQELTAELLDSAAVRRREPDLQLLFNQMPALIWSTDTDLHLTAVTGTGLAGIGLPCEKAEGRIAEEFFQPLAPQFPSRELHRKALRGETVQAEMELAGGNAEAYIAPLRGAEGEITGCIGFAVDTSRRKRREIQFQEGERQFSLTLDAAFGKIAEQRRGEEALRDREQQLQRELQAAVAEITSRRQKEEGYQERARQLQAELEAASAQLAESRLQAAKRGRRKSAKRGGPDGGVARRQRGAQKGSRRPEVAGPEEQHAPASVTGKEGAAPARPRRRPGRA